MLAASRINLAQRRHKHAAKQRWCHWAHVFVLTAAATSAFAKPEVPQGRSPVLQPFAVDSPWNTPLGSAATLAESSSTCAKQLQDQTVGSDINAAQWSHPIYAAKATDPKVVVRVYGDVVATLQVPRNATPAAPRTKDTDGHLHIIDPTGQYVDELWRARWQGDHTLLAEAYHRNLLSGSGVGQGGVRAYGGSAIGGLIRKGELKDGIRHALALAVPRAAQKPGPIWPATQQDDGAEGTYRGALPMGQLLSIPRSVNGDALHLGPQGLVLLRALQDFGAYDVDSAADYSLYAEPSVETELGSARADWIKLRPLLRCVTNTSSSFVGGPGARVTTPNPPLMPVPQVTTARPVSRKSGR